jgi:peptidyl-prolyl cis-trans isomerase SurA
MNNFLLILLLLLNFNIAQSIETKIIHKIQNQIITNVDIKNEFKYLLAFNNSLKELDKEKILSISNESVIKERIKEIELSKNYKEIKIDEEYKNILLKNLYSKLNLQSLEEFKLYLMEYDLNIEEIEKRITIDSLWNKLIIRKYASQVNINKKKIEKEISLNNNKQIKEYELAEIIFEVDNKEEIERKYNEIKKSITAVGFQNSASIYSIAATAKAGGNIGLINENSLNNKIKKNIINLKNGEISKPIILSNGILILKVINTKNSKIKTNFEDEFKKAVNYERNRQLNQFSIIYYNKIKKNLAFYE